MIEREFIAQKTKEYYIKQYVKDTLPGAEISKVVLKKIPLGEKIVVVSNRPSLVVGSKGANIRALTKALKQKFKLENPQIEIEEVKDFNLDAQVVAERIKSSLERFGSARFKGIGHKTLSNVMAAGALGVEIKISGKIPGSRAKSWRFYMGYLKKCGDVSVSGVRKAYTSALLKSGVIGIQVRIMPSDLILPDHVEILEEQIYVEESEDKEVKESKSVESTKTSKVKKAKVEETKAQEVKAEEVKAEEVKVEETKSQEVKAEEVKKVEETKVEETKAKEVKNEGESQ